MPFFQDKEEALTQYAWNLQKALLVFQHQTIMDTASGRRIHLTPLPSRCLFYSWSNSTSSSGVGVSGLQGKWIMEQVTDFSFLGPITATDGCIAVANVHTTERIHTHTAQEKKLRNGISKSATSSANNLWGFSFTQKGNSQTPSSRLQWIGGEEGAEKSGQVVADAGGVFTAGAYRSQLISNDYLTLYRRKKRHYPTTATFAVAVPAVSVGVVREHSANGSSDRDGREDATHESEVVKTDIIYERDEDNDNSCMVTEHQGRDSPVRSFIPLNTDKEDAKFHFPTHTRKRRSYFETSEVDEEIYRPHSSDPTTGVSNTYTLTSSDLDEDYGSYVVQPNSDSQYRCKSGTTEYEHKITDFNRYFSHMTSGYAYLEPPAPYHQECSRSVTPTRRSSIIPTTRWFFPV